MKTLFTYILILLSGNVTKPFSTNDTPIEKYCIGSLFFNQATGEDVLHSNLSESFFGSMLSDVHIRQIQNEPYKNKIVTHEEANGLKKSGINLHSEKFVLTWALHNFDIKAVEGSRMNRPSKMAVADISQRGIAER